MTNEQKSAIARLRLDGCKYAAIAEAVGLSINTVKSYCRRKNINAITAATPDANGLPRCRQCGEPLKHAKGKKPRKFCSDACRHEWWKSHPNELDRKAFYTKTCVHCGKSYTVYGRPHSKYCCHECSAQHRIQKAEASA